MGKVKKSLASDCEGQEMIDKMPAGDLVPDGGMSPSDPGAGNEPKGIPGVIGGLEDALNKSEAKADACIKFIVEMVNTPCLLPPSAKVRAQEFLARIK